MSNTVMVRRPTAAPAGEVRAETFTLDRPIAGVHVGIRTDGAWRSWRLIASVWDEYLRRDGATTSLVETGGMVGQTGREWHGVYLTKPKDAKAGYWYGPASPADGWSAVPDVPDPERHAGEPPHRRSRKR